MKAQDYNQSSYQFVARLLPSNKDVSSRTMSIEKVNCMKRQEPFKELISRCKLVSAEHKDFSSCC